MKKTLTGYMALAALFTLSTAIAGDPQQRVAFVASATGSADLSSWPEAGEGLQGLAAADSICQNLADNANLQNPGNFAAWLSDSNDDAYCRLNGLSGKKSSNCGQGSLPVNAGPWVRSDGVPFAPQIDEMAQISADIYTPLLKNENGTPLPDTTVFTGTSSDGTQSGEHCSDWTVDSGGSLLIVGNTSATTNQWSAVGGLGNCASTIRFYCFETGTGPSLDLPTDAGAPIAFVTSARGTGDLGSWPEAQEGAEGIEAGDSICKRLADDAALPFADKYKAWLSDASTDAIDRFDTDGPWSRLDFFEIASNLSQLTDGKLFTSINVNESGSRRTQLNVWTGTHANGMGSSAHCNSWTSASNVDDGLRGVAVLTGEDWSDRGNLVCDNQFGHLYCLRDFDPDLVYKDGFEADE